MPDRSSSRAAIAVDRGRGRSVAATLIVHLGVVALLMWWPTAPLPPNTASPALMTFDVEPPPEPPRIVPADPVAVPPDPATTRNDDPGGASAGRPAPREGPVVVPPVPRPEVPPPPARIDASPIRAVPIVADGFAAELVPAAPSSAGLGSAVMGVGIGGDAGAGSGDGRGDGSGSGRGRGRLVRARWVRAPTNREMVAFWPVAARQAKLSGKAILECVVPKVGPPRSCRALLETPAGSGFGQAAVAMSPIFRIAPVTRGRAVEDLPIIVPVTFRYTGR